MKRDSCILLMRIWRSLSESKRGRVQVPVSWGFAMNLLSIQIRTRVFSSDIMMKTDMIGISEENGGPAEIRTPLRMDSSLWKTCGTSTDYLFRKNVVQYLHSFFPFVFIVPIFEISFCNMSGQRCLPISIRWFRITMFI